jgi:hypothetical protein
MEKLFYHIVERKQYNYTAPRVLLSPPAIIEGIKDTILIVNFASKLTYPASSNSISGSSGWSLRSSICIFWAMTFVKNLVSPSCS